MILWFNMDQVDNSKPITWKGVFHLFLIIGGLVAAVIFLEFRREKLLDDHGTTWAIIKHKSSGGYKHSYKIMVKYKVHGKQYEEDGVGGWQYNDCISKFRVGDSVLIKYSLKDPTVVSIKECEESK